MEFKKILVPVDGSDPSMNAFHCALDLAKAHKTEMILLYVIDANEMFYATNQVMLSGEFFETMKGVGTKLIEKLVSEIPEDVPHKSICVVGIPGETASDIAKQYGIKVYTVGIGTNGMAMFPYAIAPNGKFLFQMMKVEIDEQLMKNIARKTDGKYFRATSNSKLAEIYASINKLETTEIEELKFYDYDEKFRPFIWFAGFLLLAEIGLRNTVFRSFI